AGQDVVHLVLQRPTRLGDHRSEEVAEHIVDALIVAGKTAAARYVPNDIRVHQIANRVQVSLVECLIALPGPLDVLADAHRCWGHRRHLQIHKRPPSCRARKYALLRGRLQAPRARVIEIVGDAASAARRRLPSAPPTRPESPWQAAAPRPSRSAS